jgi:hypothetical protein
MWSLRIVMLLQVMLMIVKMTRPPRTRLLQELLSMRSLLSSTLHQYASWLRPLRYNLIMSVMRNMIKLKVKIKMMNQLKMNYLTCYKMLKNILTLRKGNAKACIRN